MSESGERRKCSATEKLRIVLAGMRPNVELAELGGREGFNPTQQYGWTNQLSFAANKIFDEAASRPSTQEAKQAAEL